MKFNSIRFDWVIRWWMIPFTTLHPLWMSFQPPTPIPLTPISIEVVQNPCIYPRSAGHYFRFKCRKMKSSLHHAQGGHMNSTDDPDSRSNTNTAINSPWVAWFLWLLLMQWENYSPQIKFFFPTWWLLIHTMEITKFCFPRDCLLRMRLWRNSQEISSKFCVRDGPMSVSWSERQGDGFSQTITNARIKEKSLFILTAT